MAEFISHFDFNFNATGQLEFHKGVDGLGTIVDFDVHQTSVRAQFELLARLLVDESRTVDSKNLFVCRQRYGAIDHCARHLDGLHDLLGRLVDEVVIVRFEFDSNSLTHGF